MAKKSNGGGSAAPSGEGVSTPAEAVDETVRVEEPIPAAQPEAKTSSGPSIEPEAMYAVRLRRPVTRPNGRILKPRNGLTVKGKALVEFLDQVAEYERV